MAVADKLMDTMAQPFYQESLSSPTLALPGAASSTFPSALGPSVHGHTNRWVPAAQAIFTTEAKPPWTIIAANDLACLVFGVTKAEVRKTGILEVVQEERRAWLERKLLCKDDENEDEGKPSSRPRTPASSAASALLGGRLGITAQLLSKPNSRSQQPKNSQRRAQTVHSGDPNPPKTRGSGRHRSARSRGVLLCGDVVPIQKRNGATGSASLWVKEKRVGLIWVLEEIHEDTAYVDLDEEGIVKGISGATKAIWGIESTKPGLDIGALIPRIPRQGIDPNTGEIDFAQIRRRKFFTCPNAQRVNIPCTIEQVRGKIELRVSSYPHIAGMIVLDPQTLHIRSSNSVFCGALFGFEKPDGMSINALVPGFDKILEMLTEGEGLELLDGMVIPEDRFRRASGLLAIKEHRPDASEAFLKPDGLPAKHRDGSDLKIDVQMRVVKSEKQVNLAEETVIEGSDEDNESKKDDSGTFVVPQSEMVYALWITYSRHMHAEQPMLSVGEPSDTGAVSPPHQPSPGQTPPALTPLEIASDEEAESKKEQASKTSSISKHIKDAAMNAAAKLTGQKQAPSKSVVVEKAAAAKPKEPPAKKTIDDYVILEDMGQGAYGQVKLARHKQTGKKAVLKYVTKRRILVDTWTRDRKLGTVPLEIHVLDYLRRPEFRHPNIVEMEGFFEDDVNYYIEMKPHGLPGMDLFDYIELRTNMDESECRSIFKQVAQAVYFLHAKANVVHRDIKDENVILDGEGNIKLIDFGSAAYIKSGPFDVFVGTIGKSSAVQIAYVTTSETYC
jgi:protein-serine/threonine kinase